MKLKKSTLPSNILPSAKPRLSSQQLHEAIAYFSIDRNTYPLILIGIRGYYLQTMGQKNVNDRGIYDDAIFIDSPSATISFNANTDPSLIHPGSALLQPGVYYAHRFDIHYGKHSQHPAICQRCGPVTILRDGQTTTETGSQYGINIHKGGNYTTGSQGCQTIPPAQWKAFYDVAKSEAKRLYGENWNKMIIPYVLLENVGQF